MNKQKGLLLSLTLLLMGGGGGVLGHLRAHQRLGAPGVKTHPLAHSNRLVVDLPERVLDYQSKWVEPDELTTNTLPADTSFGQREYRAPDGFVLSLNVVLMGGDRTSLHKPQYCLAGQGWNIDPAASVETSIPVSRPCPYDLPVVELVSNKQLTRADGQTYPARGLYVYWYVAQDALSASVGGYQRQWWMAKHLLRTGELQRWAYVSCFAVCPPGQEGATFDRMKQFIAAAVPQFQLTPTIPAGAPGAIASDR